MKPPSPERLEGASRCTSRFTLTTNKQRVMMMSSGAARGSSVSPANVNGPKRAWKLQENAAHQSSVNCLTLGRKSGRVMATGGDDKRVNLWAIGKTGCIMSLSGHATPVECVRFGQTEEMVCAGSLSGAIKLWDLEEAKMVRTLSGHKGTVKCLDFHPYGDFLASGSQDNTIKLWDVRRRGCIFTYKGHERAVNTIQFSPDGQWVASGSDDSSVRIWDLRAGKALTVFKNSHTSSVKTVVFHPHEFLLASGSVDRRVVFWDLECFEKVSSAGGSGEVGSGAIRSLVFNPTGDCLFAGIQDTLKVYGWEPGRTLDTLVLNWGRVADLAIAQSQLIGASFQGNEVAVYVVDLKRVLPAEGGASKEKGAVLPAVGTNGSVASKPMRSTSTTIHSPTNGSVGFLRGGPGRKSFSREQKSPSPTDIKIEAPTDSEGFTDVEDSLASNVADILDPGNYTAIFQPRRRELARTPPPPAPFTPPSEDTNTFIASLPPVAPATANRRFGAVRVGSLPSLEHRHSIATSGGGGGGMSLQRRRESLSGGSSSSSSSSSSTLPHSSSSVTVGGVGGEKGRSRSESRRRYQQGGGYGLLSSTPEDHSAAYHHPNMVTSLEIPSKEVDPHHPLLFPVLSAPSPFGGNRYPFPHLLGGHPLVHSTSLSLIHGIGTNGTGDCFAPVEEIMAQHPLDASSFGAGILPDNFLPNLCPRRSTSFSGVLHHHQSSGNGMMTVVDMSESEVISQVSNNHLSMLKVLAMRQKSVQILHSLWQKKDVKSSVEYAVGLADRGDHTVFVDFLGILLFQESVWNLDICLLLLPHLSQLLQSTFESYVTQGGKTLKLILKNFVPVIRSQMNGPVNVGVGVDISREERRRKSMACYENLVSIRAFILKRQTLQGPLGHLFRELGTMIQNLD